MLGDRTPSSLESQSPRPQRGGRRALVRRWLQFLLVFVSVVLLANALVGDQGLVATYRARAQALALTEEIDRLQSENAALREDARRLTDDPRAIERVARKNLGLIRPGEIVALVAPASRHP